MPDDPRTDPQDRSWYGPHDRLFTQEESEPLDFQPGPEAGKCLVLPCYLYRGSDGILRIVWCWGWDGAGDLDGPDVEPIWEAMPNRSTIPDAVRVRHVRDF